MKHFTTTDILPVNSEERKSIASTLPVFFFSGPVEIGVSGVWSPPHEIRLVNGWCQARTTGTALAGFVILKSDGMDTLTNLSQILMPAHLRRATFTFGEHFTLTPYETLFVASFAASNHEDVSIQIFGNRV